VLEQLERGVAAVLAKVTRMGLQPKLGLFSCSGSTRAAQLKPVRRATKANIHIRDGRFRRN